MWIDAHCHLDQLQPSPGEVIRQAREMGVEKVVAVSEKLSSMKEVLQLHRDFPDTVIPALGIHPALSVSLTPDDRQQALDFLEENLDQVEIVGEVGLDHKYARTDEEKEDQLKLLHRQLELAAQRGAAINLHSRRALRQTMNEAVAYKKRTGHGALLHWFTQSKKLIRICNQEGIYVSVGPTVLGSEQTAQVVATIDREFLLLETDSPVPFDGESASPTWIPRVAATVAEIFEMTLDELEQQVEENFARYLGEETLSMR